VEAQLAATGRAGKGAVGPGANVFSAAAAAASVAVSGTNLAAPAAAMPRGTPAAARAAQLVVKL
jgi:hypothetical protein